MIVKLKVMRMMRFVICLLLLCSIVLIVLTDADGESSPSDNCRKKFTLFVLLPVNFVLAFVLSNEELSIICFETVETESNNIVMVLKFLERNLKSYSSHKDSYALIK